MAMQFFLCTDFSDSALLAEIKEMSERNQNDDEVIHSVQDGQCITRPHMEFEYPDPDIHEDLYQILRLSCGEVCTPEQSDKIMKTWTTFVETLLNVSSRPSSTDVHKTDAMPSSDHSLETCKPLNLEIPMALHDEHKNTRLFYGNDSFYLLFRLHQTLYERMRGAKLQGISNDANPTESYTRFKDALHSLLKGSIANEKFEDECRAIVGSQSNILLTLDKLILKLVKQLQIIASEKVEKTLLQLFAYERTRNPQDFVDAIYYENVCFFIPDYNYLYRIECFPGPTRLTIQLIKKKPDKPEPDAVRVIPDLEAYLNDELLSVVPETKEKSRMLLLRNKRKFLNGDDVADYNRVTDGLVIRNGHQIRISSVQLRPAYVLGDEDFMYRVKSKLKRK